MASARKTEILFVDDDSALLNVLRELMGQFSAGAWEVNTASDTAKALACLQDKTIDLLVIDIHMPVVDGLQFLKLLQRKYPNTLKVVLTGDTTGSYRAACLNSGAELYLEKPRTTEGWQTVYATLKELVRFQPEEGFRGVLRRVGLQDILQLECLSRNSSIMDISTPMESGQVFIREGQIIHAQTGKQKGVEAFYALMALGGGEFHLRPFVEPPEVSIEGIQWEGLLMDAAQHKDELAERQNNTAQEEAPESAAESYLAELCPLQPSPSLENVLSSVPSLAMAPEETTPPEQLRPKIEEVLICSPQGEVLYEWQCANTNSRISFLEFLSQKALQLSQGLPLGKLDRLEARDDQSRTITQIQSSGVLFVRTSLVPVVQTAETSEP